ncbi:MAG: quinolinate synthase NadA [Desulfobacteraceae bacterium]|nr:quinolinate synthase NadA [Desulfobacteraceae bacterium]
MSSDSTHGHRFMIPKTSAPPPLPPHEKERLIRDLVQQFNEIDATLVAHYYTDTIVQELAEACGGFIGDSLEMARFGAQTDAGVIIVAGVRFMGETAKILSPEKRVFMPTLDATCSLDLGCPVDDFAAYCDKHPDRTIVVYANTSAAVKARADWVVTSSIAVDVVKHLHAGGEKILWAPDQYLGTYIRNETGADMKIWTGSCVVHEEFKADELKEMKQRFPDAAVLVHPESPAPVIALADVVGSTTQLLNASKQLPNPLFIVATDKAIFYKMKQASPDKAFYEAPTAGEGATCLSCAHCPWMAMNTIDNLKKVLNALAGGASEAHLTDFEIIIDADLAAKAIIPLNRMVNFSSRQRQK